MRLVEILPGFYTRGNLNRIPSKGRQKALAGHGIDLLIGLVGQPQSPEVVHGIREYVHVPLSDGKRIAQRDVEALVARIVDRLSKGWRVLVYCNAGRNRAGLIATLVVAVVQGVSGAEALAYVRERRPRAVANPRFEQYILTGR